MQLGHRVKSLEAFYQSPYLGPEKGSSFAVSLEATRYRPLGGAVK